MSSKAQREVLIGKQSSAGTGVNVDVALRATADFKAVPDKIEVEEDIGSFAPARHYIGSLKSEGSLEYDGYFEHAPYPISMALGAGYINPGAYALWTFDLPESVAPTLALYSMEYTDGADHIVRGVDVFATGLEISGEAGQSWMFKPTIVGGETTYPAAVSASPAAPATVTPILMANTVLSVDDTFETFGTTDVAELISFNWKLDNLMHQKLFAGSLWPTDQGHDKFEITLELIVEAEQARMEVVKARLLNTTQSAIRLKATSGSNTATIDGIFYLQDVDTLDDRDGNNTLKYVFKGERPTAYWYVGASGHSIKVECTLASL